MGKKETIGNLALHGQERQIIEIQATEQQKKAKLRVAAYIRVSSSSEDQLNSFDAQRRHYDQLITSQEDQELVGIYADEGITGTSVEKRDGFLRLLADCRRGLIDRVMAKSISRFARNTKECLMAIRELKALNVSVYFEEQRIDTAIATGETMTTMFASIAQAESESISKNMRWSYQRRMEKGDFITCKPPFGYELVAGNLEIKNEEAQIIKEIFNRFLNGDSTDTIARWVSTTGFPTRDGSLRWQHTTIAYILQNEKYAGNTLLKKFYTTYASTTRKKGI